jgi:hypothetical protein
MCDDMMSAAAGMTGIEAKHSGFSASSDSKEHHPEPYKLVFEIGEGIVIYIGADFAPKRDIPRRQLNDIVVFSLFPTILQAAATHLGQRQDYISSLQPQNPVVRSETRRTASQLLGIIPSQPTLFDSLEDAESSAHRRQAMAR